MQLLQLQQLQLLPLAWALALLRYCGLSRSPCRVLMLSLCLALAWALTLALCWAPSPIPALNLALTLGLPPPWILSSLLMLSLVKMPILTLWPALTMDLITAGTQILCPAPTPTLSPTLTPALPPMTAQPSLPVGVPNGCKSEGHYWGQMAEGDAGTHGGLMKLCVVQSVKSSHCLLALFHGSVSFPPNAQLLGKWEGVA